MRRGTAEDWKRIEKAGGGGIAWPTLPFGDGIDWNAEAKRAAEQDAVGRPETCEMLEAIRAALGPCERPRVADCGCNIGQFFPMFHKAGFEYVGLDQAAESLKIARERWPAGQFVEAFLWDAWPRRFEPFDVAICNAVLQHNTHEEKRQILPRIARALRAGGLFAMQESTVLQETRTQLRQEQWIALVEGHGFKLLQTWHKNELSVDDGYLFKRVA